MSSWCIQKSFFCHEIVELLVTGLLVFSGYDIAVTGRARFEDEIHRVVDEVSKSCVSVLRALPN